MKLNEDKPGNTWAKALNISLIAILLLIIGYQMAQSEKANERLKRMEVSVAVCGDVAAYFAPDTEMDEIVTASKKWVRK